MESKSYYQSKTIVVTGGTGSWGQELITQLLEESPKEIRIVSRGEHAQVEMMRKFNHPHLSFYIGDVRDKGRLLEVMRDAEIVFHLAALKHVPVCERHIWETVQTNTVGTQNVIDAARANNVEKAILVSSDKSVDPINLYGNTKAIAEKMFITANILPGETKLSCIRAGNILGTHGSVVPLFRDQILRKNIVTLTDDRMTRFLVSPEKAIRFLTAMAVEAKGGEIFVPKMPSVEIKTLAQTMIRSLGNKDTKMVTTGIRPGEKVHEFLISQDEGLRTAEYQNHFAILPYQFLLNELPQLSQYKANLKLRGIYSSEVGPHLGEKEIEQMLRENHYLS